MSFLEAFPARTSAAPVRGQESKAVGQAYGQKWHELSVKYDPVTCSWKTHQCLFPEDLPWSSVTLPAWGMTRTGHVYQHLTAERPMSVTESGLLPTPTASQMGSNTHLRKMGMTVKQAYIQWATPTTMDRLPPKSPEALHREATIARPGRSKPSNLRDQVSNAAKWPTPTANCHKGAGSQGRMGGLNLQTAVAQKWPTPQASDCRDRGNMSDPVIQRRIAAGKQVNLSMRVKEQQGGGSLNPNWVEWLMGWPIGWTDLKPLEMDKFRKWQQLHGIFCWGSDE